MSGLQFKTMLVCFFDQKGIVHYESIAQRQTVNQQCYLEVLTRLRESAQRKVPDTWILHHDNAPGHDALRVRECDGGGSGGGGRCTEKYLTDKRKQHFSMKGSINKIPI
jgi:hypothetical protein